MNILVVGAGGREHALVWKIAQSPQVVRVFCAPGNAGMAHEPKVNCVPVAADDVVKLVDLARQQEVDLVMVGPEQPLVLGLTDRLAEHGIPVVGPSRQAARLEGSKVFAKRMMRRHGVPTADFQVFDSAEPACDFLRRNPGRWVVKADGLAAGKGVIPCETVEESTAAVEQIMVQRRFGQAGDQVLIESFLEGEEASCIALTDGRDFLMLASSQDHKRALDGDQGPNTGGMGAYSPAPVVDSAMEQNVIEQVFRPLVQGMAADGIPFKGVLYAGLMIAAGEFHVLEFNVRFGDPETQALLPRLKSDLVPALLAVAREELAGVELDWDPRPSVSVVMAAGGYPGSYQKGKQIRGLEKARELRDTVVFEAGTRNEGGQRVTAGGRVLAVTCLGDDIRQAVERSYRAVEKISFDGARYRRDIAHRALARKGNRI